MRTRAVVGGGKATLTALASWILNKKALTIVYDGNGDFLSSKVVPPVLTRKSLGN